MYISDGTAVVPSPSASPSKKGAQPSISTKSLPTGIHRTAPQGSSYRESRPRESTSSRDTPIQHEAAYPPHRHPPNQHSHSESPHRTQADPLRGQGQNYNPSSGQGEKFDLQERNWSGRPNVTDVGYPQRSMHPTRGGEEWNSRGDTGGYYFASHV